MLRYLHPRWIALHVLVLASCYGMYYAGGWQWRVAKQHHGDLRNYAYSIQWYVFVAFTIWFWVKVMRDSRRRAVAGASPPPEPPWSADSEFTSTPSYRGYAMPQAAAITVDDPELARYNEYLGALADQTVTPTAAPAAPAPAESTPAMGTGPRPVHTEGRL